MINGYKLPPQELTPQRKDKLERALQDYREMRQRAFTETQYNDFTRAIDSIERALRGENL
jgi:hypothetical protein